MDEQLLASLAPTLSSEAKNKLTKKERNEAFILSYFLGQSAGSKGPIMPFFASKQGVDKKIAQVNEKAAQDLATTATAALAPLQTQLATAQAALAPLQTQLAQAQADLATAQTALAPLQTQLAQAQANWTLSQGNFTQAQTQLTTANNRLADIASRLNAYVTDMNLTNTAINDQATYRSQLQDFILNGAGTQPIPACQ